MYSDLYAEKRTTAEQALSDIADSSTIVHGMACGEPPALLGALADRLRAGDLKDVSIYSLLPGKYAQESYLAVDLSDCVNACTWFVSPADRNMVRVGLNHFVPNLFHQIPRFISELMDVDVTLTVVSPMDKNGFFTLGTANDYISTAVRCCRKLVVEVNPQMPRVFGDSLLHISEVDALIENEVPLMEVNPTEPKPEAAAIGKIVAAEVPDGATIQVGFGGIPNAVCDYLSGRRDLGIHSELMCPGIADLIRKGVATGRRKTFHPRKHLFTNVLGDRGLYDFIHDNPSCESYPVSYINDPVNIARQEDFISINATIEVDLLGQCNSESIGGRQYSGTGGQLDFVRGAFNSKGGKSIIAFYSTARNGEISRVVPRLEAGAVVTVPRMDTHYLATEYGIVNLKGKSVSERALAVISLAHPKFRDGLMREAENMYLI